MKGYLLVKREDLMRLLCFSIADIEFAKEEIKSLEYFRKNSETHQMKIDATSELLDRDIEKLKKILEEL